MRKLTLLLLALVLVALVGCDTQRTPSATKQQAKATAEAMGEAQRQVGMPNITNWQQRRLMKMIQEECDKEGLVCHAYLHSEYTGQLVYLGKCLGYGVPFSAQFTNPMVLTRTPGPGAVTVPQPDPNGLYMPSSSSATWLLLIDPKTNEPRVAYMEPNIVVVPFALPPGPAVLGGP